VKLVACTYRQDRNSPWRIAVIPSEGGQPVKIFDTPVPISYWPVLRWTADGRAILYVDEHNGVGNIWSQPADGGKPVQVTDFKSDFINTFDLSRDGKQLVNARGTTISEAEEILQTHKVEKLPLIDEDDRLAGVVSDSGYLDATRDVLRDHGGLWFYDESYVISRRRE